MKNKNIVMILILVILLSITLIGTYAYQMYTQEIITNTFTVGDVSVEFYEKDENGNRVENINQNYILKRDTTYYKNMVVNIKEGSEACYIYIVMQNDLANVESEEVVQDRDNLDVDPYTPIANQISGNGWSERASGKSNVKIYWQSFDKNDREAYEKDFMSSFRTSASYDYNDVPKSDNISPVMTFKIYAIEKSNLTETQAWGLLQGKFTELSSY